MKRHVRIVLTPEHVPIRLTPGGLGSRFLAVLLDFVLILAAIAVLSIVPRLLLPRGFAAAIVGTITFVVTWGYHVYFEVRHQGRTPGKRAAGLRVVDGRGLPLTLQQSFVRNVVRALDLAPVFYGVGGISALLDRDHRRLGDVLADTLVVEERRPLAPPDKLDLGRRQVDFAADPGLLRRIRHRVSLEERELLLSLCLRADGLAAGPRYDLMEEVGDHYRRRLEIDAPHLSGEAIVRDLAAVFFGDAGASSAASKTAPRAAARA